MAGDGAGRHREQSKSKVVEHPAVGRITVDCDVLFVATDDVRLMVYTADPGSADADRLALAAGFRGARYLSAEASAHGQWQPGGSARPGMDAYATSKQGNLATVLAFARETPRLRFNAVEPGFSPGSRLGRDAATPLRFVSTYLLSPLAPFITYWSTQKRAAQVITEILTADSTVTGVYYDENGTPMLGSAQVRDPVFNDRVVAETRALLMTV